ncbi:MAG: peptide-methionine (S)-S-oxide reductase MsrA [Spirochaetaceae bacterium]|nr:peptide-methionine (S)-S-oxide reductase MsrA [Spirochaetaceae bacterium]
MADNRECIILGGGCFWCIEAVYKRIPGVISTRPGYAGGTVKNPDYNQVTIGETGHAEVVEVCFDTTAISLTAILEVFWRAHNPTTLNRQGNDIGSQYRSVVFYNNEAQKEAAETSLQGLIHAGIYKSLPVTRIEPLETLWPAEEYHKDYFEANRGQSYCRMVIEPKLHKLALMED